MTGPGGLSSLVRMEDSGTGYPDITASDGVYTGYLASLASRPGHYNVRIILSDNDGAAVAPRRRGEQMMTFNRHDSYNHVSCDDIHSIHNSFYDIHDSCDGIRENVSTSHSLYWSRFSHN